MRPTSAPVNGSTPEPLLDFFFEPPPPRRLVLVGSTPCDLWCVGVGVGVRDV
jgi:hypothetical protein